MTLIRTHLSMFHLQLSKIAKVLLELLDSPRFEPAQLYKTRTDQPLEQLSRPTEIKTRMHASARNRAVKTWREQQITPAHAKPAISTRVSSCHGFGGTHAPSITESQCPHADGARECAQLRGADAVSLLHVRRKP